MELLKKEMASWYITDHSSPPKQIPIMAPEAVKAVAATGAQSDAKSTSHSDSKPAVVEELKLPSAAVTVEKSTNKEIIDKICAEIPGLSIDGEADENEYPADYEDSNSAGENPNDTTDDVCNYGVSPMLHGNKFGPN